MKKITMPIQSALDGMPYGTKGFLGLAYEKGWFGMSKKNFKPNNGRSAKKTIIVVCSVLLGVTLCELGTAALYINHMLDKIDYENTPGQEDGESVVDIYDDQNLWNDDVLNVLLLGTDERSEEYNDNARS